jgi:hypothetical protein
MCALPYTLLNVAVMLQGRKFMQSATVLFRVNTSAYLSPEYSTVGKDGAFRDT